ncbi:MAG: hypothetical protein QOJ40_1957 [Verrucomicrobiota bacterium]
MSGEYWENRYQSQDMPWEKGEPSPGLVDFLAAHPGLSRSSPPSPRDEGVGRGPGRGVFNIARSATAAGPHHTVCVPGCGTGHDVRAWARAGFQAFGYDIAPSAIRLATERTRAAGLSAQFQLADFLHDEPPFLFDWVFEHTLFCAIQPGERDDYVRSALRWLKPGGQYLAVNYLIPDKEGPPFGTTREELWQRFSPHFDLVKEWVPRSYPNRTGLELMLWWRRRH